jgi:methylated-DNA-[protein]-cysteine S-methyltransferase
MSATSYCYYDSPVGRLLLAATDDGLRCICFPGEQGVAGPRADWQAGSAPLNEAMRQLTEYFAGKLERFDLRLAPDGTPFQKAVWARLLDIPYGATASYSEIAHAIGRPRACRAVGAANGRNPLPIVVPCHRVIGSNGELVGYGGGLQIKKALLELERRHLRSRPRISRMNAD